MIVQIEHVEAVKNIDSILDVAGIDGVFVGVIGLCTDYIMLARTAAEYLKAVRV